MGLASRNLVHAAADYGLRGAILIDQPGGGRVPPPEGQALVGEGFAADDQGAHRARRRFSRENVRHQFEVSRSELDQAEIRAAAERFRQALVSLLVQEDHPVAGRERREQAGNRQVESDRSVQRCTAPLPQEVGRRRPGDITGERRVRYRHSLGPAGGAGGEQHVGDALGQSARRRILAVPDFQEPGILVPAENPPAVSREMPGQVAAGDNQRDRCRRGHHRAALLGVGWIQRHVGAPRFEHSEQGGHQIDAALQRHPDRDLRPHSQRSEKVGDAVGTGVQGRVGETPLGRLQRGRLGLAPDLLLKGVVDQRRRGGR